MTERKTHKSLVCVQFIGVCGDDGHITDIEIEFFYDKTEMRDKKLNDLLK